MMSNGRWWEAYRRLAREAELLPYAEPGVRGAELVVASIGGFAVGEREGPRVGHCVNALQQLNVGDGLLGVHCDSAILRQRLDDRPRMYESYWRAMTRQDRPQGGQSCRSDQEPSLTIRSAGGSRPVTSG